MFAICYRMTAETSLQLLLPRIGYVEEDGWINGWMTGDNTLFNSGTNINNINNRSETVSEVHMRINLLVSF